MEPKIPPDFWTWIQSDGGRIAVAGAAGGVVRWLTLRQNWKEGAIAMIVGAICAKYLGPLVVPILEPALGRFDPGGDNIGLLSFLVGLGGISISGLLIDIFRARQKQTKESTHDHANR